MIGSIVLRGNGMVLAIGAEDLEVGTPSRWRVKIVLAGEGMRVETPGTLLEDELPALGRDIEALMVGDRTAAKLASHDGTLFVSIERRSEAEARIAIRILRDRATGLYSVVETLAARRDVEELAQRARKFPY